ncbi:hypothetical protein [Weissella minor]|uniref:hypothetical protein n=1 Tax=Weissella minor TaxID=1620 RepID=UPI00070ECB74|nr:hypothetical protein [Weissella minor]
MIKNITNWILAVITIFFCLCFLAAVTLTLFDWVFETLDTFDLVLAGIVTTMLVGPFIYEEISEGASEDDDEL